MDEEKNDGLKSLSQNFKKRVWIVLVTFVLLALMVFVGFRALHLDFNLVNTSIMVGVFCVVYALLMVFVKEVDSALLGLVMLLFCGQRRYNRDQRILIGLSERPDGGACLQYRRYP